LGSTRGSGWHCSRFGGKSGELASARFNDTNIESGRISFGRFHFLRTGATATSIEIWEQRNEHCFSKSDMELNQVAA